MYTRLSLEKQEVSQMNHVTTIHLDRGRAKHLMFKDGTVDLTVNSEDKERIPGKY